MNASNTLKKLGIEQTFNYIYKDPDKNMEKLMDWADKFSKGDFPSQRKAIREAIENPEHPYYSYVRKIFKEVDPNVAKTLAVNLFINAALIGWPKEEELREKCRQWTFSLSGKGRASTVCCNGVPIRGEVRTEQVGMLAARIATVPVVREVLREAQRAMGEATPLVVEGRDMGTVVFPDARFKFFLDASPEVRALRRLRDLAARGVEADLVTLTEQIRQRDSLDRNRAVAPLRPAADAVIVDTSELDIAGVLGVLVHRISVHEGSVTLLP